MTTKIHHTKFRANDLYSKWHFLFGHKNYYLDCDEQELESGTMASNWREYTYHNGNPKTVALIDLKYPGELVSDRFSAIQYQIYSSEHEFKTPVPFFIVITYLDHQYEDKMLYVIPANVTARDLFKSWNRKYSPGSWMTVKRYVDFQHALRNLIPNPDEELVAVNLAAVGLPTNLKLKDLPNIKTTYQLPTFDLSWSGTL